MKYFLSLLLILSLSNCEIKMKEVNAQVDKKSYDYKLVNAYSGLDGTNILIKRVYLDSMQYGVIYEFSGYRGTLSVINLTKDSLEVELLKKQLK